MINSQIDVKLGETLFFGFFLQKRQLSHLVEGSKYESDVKVILSWFV